MATATRRRRPARAVTHTSAPRPTLQTQFLRAATSPAARIVYVTVGTAGLAALSIAMFGPKRFQREILKPAGAAVGDQAEKLWADARPLRDQAEKLWADSRPMREQIGKMFDRVQSESGREKLAKNFQSWIGHFRAT